MCVIFHLDKLFPLIRLRKYSTQMIIYTVRWVCRIRTDITSSRRPRSLRVCSFVYKIILIDANFYVCASYSIEDLWQYPRFGRECMRVFHCMCTAMLDYFKHFSSSLPSTEFSLSLTALCRFATDLIWSTSLLRRQSRTTTVDVLIVQAASTHQFTAPICFTYFDLVQCVPQLRH